MAKLLVLLYVDGLVGNNPVLKKDERLHETVSLQIGIIEKKKK